MAWDDSWVPHHTPKHGHTFPPIAFKPITGFIIRYNRNACLLYKLAIILWDPDGRAHVDTTRGGHECTLPKWMYVKHTCLQTISLVPDFKMCVHVCAFVLCAQEIEAPVMVKAAQNSLNNLNLNLQPSGGESVCHILTQHICGVPFVLLYIFWCFYFRQLLLFLFFFSSLNFCFVECIRVSVE